MRPSALRPLVVALAAPVALAAQEPVEIITEVPGPGDRECAEAEEPDPLPPLAQLADSAALADAVAGISTPEMERRYALYSLHYGEGGSLDWVARLRTNLPADARGGAVEALLPHLEREQPGEGWTVRLALTFGPAPRFLVGRSRVCPAVRAEDGIRRTGIIVQRSSGPGIPPLPPRELRTTRPYRLRVKVSPAGRALDVRVLRSSGTRFVDEEASDAAKAASYLPELHDGIPVLGWFELEPDAW